MFSFSGNLLPSVAGPNDDRRYLVDKGQTVQVEFTYENNGKTTQDASVGYYLSGNDKITTGDLQIGTASFELGRNSVHTTRVSVKIPVFVPAGDLYVGAIIDWNNQIDEMSAANNATYIPIRVKPGPQM